MRFSVSKNILLKPLQLVAGVVERKKSLPILSNILIAAHDNTLSLTATDLEVEIITKIPLEDGSINGEITVPGKKLMDICRTLPENELIKFELTDNHLLVRCQRSRFNLATLPVSDFPNVEQNEGVAKYEISIPQNILLYLIERTQFAMGQQDVRYYLNALLFEASNARLSAVAADGHRLALSFNDSLQLNLPEIARILIPRKGVLELAKLLTDTDDTVDLIISSNHIRVVADNITMTSKLVDGTFPDYNKAIPQNGDKILIINKEKFKQMLTRTAVLSNEKFRGIKLQLRNSSLKVIATNPELEEAEDELEIEYSGSDIDIGVNVNYLLDAINIIPSENVKLTFKNADSGVLIEEIDNPNCLYIIMPMRL